MPSIIYNIESLLQRQITGLVDRLSGIFGFDLNVYRATDTTYEDVYGRSSDAESDFTYQTTIQGLLISGEGFIINDDYSIGSFEEGYLYTSSDDVKVGDMIEVVRSDSLKKKYKVIAEESLGSTTQVLKRFRLSALGD